MPRNRSQQSSDTKTVKAIVLVDSYAYVRTDVEFDGDGNRLVTRTRVAVPEVATAGSAKGTEVEVSEAEFERGSSMTPPALAKAGSKEAKRFLGILEEGPPTGTLNELSDDDLKAIVAARGANPDDMSRDELIGFVGGTPDNPSSNPAKT